MPDPKPLADFKVSENFQWSAKFDNIFPIKLHWKNKGIKWVKFQRGLMHLCTAKQIKNGACSAIIIIILQKAATLYIIIMSLCCPLAADKSFFFFLFKC